MERRCKGKKKPTEIKEDADGHKRGSVFFFLVSPLFVLRSASSYLPEYGYRPAANYQVNKRHHRDQTIVMQVSKRLAKRDRRSGGTEFSRIFIGHPWRYLRARRPTRQMIGQATMEAPLGLLGLLKYAHILDRLPLEGPG